MSEFAKKVLAGEQTQDAEWVEYLLEAHAIAPSMSPKCFAKYEINPGLNSYEKLASTLDRFSKKTSPTVLDLACGDGYLIRYCFARSRDPKSVIGVDMSPDELNIAKKNFQNEAKVSFRLEKAQNLGLPDQSVDIVLCHMAFMLMLPIEPVVRQLHRVLKPDGLFSAIVGNPANAGGTLKEFQAVIGAFFQSEFPRMSHPHTGDPRTQSSTGLEGLFNRENGFAGIDQIDDFNLNIRTAPEDIWEFWGDMYLISLIPAEKKAMLRQRLILAADQRKEADGLVRFQLPMRQFTVRRQ